MNYSELLRHPYWQKKRLEIFRRDNFTCQCCSDTFTELQVHHKHYTHDTLPWDYPNDALVTLCELCHKKEEFIKWLRKVIEFSLFEFRFTSSDIVEVRELIIRRLKNNLHRDSAVRYMEDIKKLLSNG